MLVEVVNEGGAGMDGSSVFEPIPSFSTALGGWYIGAASRLRGRDGGDRSNLIPHSSQYSLPSILLVPQLLHLIMSLDLWAAVTLKPKQATRLYSRPYVASIIGVGGWI